MLHGFLVKQFVYDFETRKKSCLQAVHLRVVKADVATLKNVISST